MLDCFNQHWDWGEGLPGTVAGKHQTEGPNRRPKGIPLLTLLASIDDPRTSFGLWLDEEDKWQVIQVLFNNLLSIAGKEDRARREKHIEMQENADEAHLEQPNIQKQQQIKPCFAMLEQFRRSHVQHATQQHKQIRQQQQTVWRPELMRNCHCS
jgi:hypothetical protein